MRRYNELSGFMGWFVVMALLFMAGCGKEVTFYRTVSIIPAPTEIVMGDGGFVLERNTPVTACSKDGTVRDVVSQLVGNLQGFRGGITVETDEARAVSHPSGGIVLTTADAPPGLGEEGYELTVSPDGVLIRAGTTAGLFYGVQTLLQLLPPPSDESGFALPAKIPSVTVRDIPRFRWRGMHLDVSRHFFPKEVVKNYLDIMAMHKLNVFHWHLVDGAGWRIEIKKYPRLTDIGAWRKDTTGEPWSFTNIWPPEPGGPKYGGFYTQDDIREIVAYAAERRITVVPEIEMPGHSSAALAAYPELLCDNAEPTNREYGNSGVFCAGKEETFAFLEDVLDEVMKLFPSEYIHIGGDEVPKRFWEACPSCQARMKAEGLADEEELQSWFVRRMETYLVAHGRRLVGWDEILEGGLAPEATVMSWRGMDGGVAAAKQGHDVIMTPEHSCYFNLYQGDPDLEPIAWGGFLPLRKVYAFDPVPEGLTPEEAAYVIGGQGCLWSEYIETPDMLEYMLLPRLSALAEVLWTDAERRDWDDFRERMIRQYGRFEALGLTYARSAYNVAFDIAVDNTMFDATIVMDSDAAGTEIRYTLDGSEPVVSSQRYTGPVTLAETAHVTALSFMDGRPAGKATSIGYVRHLATGKKPDLLHGYSDGYPGQGDYTLTNGLMGSKNYADGQWQGLVGNDLVAVIDLGETKTIWRVSSTYFHNPGVWIFAPTEVEYAVSDDGETYTTAALIVNDTPDDTPGPIIIPFARDIDPTSARYVRVRAKNIGVCPPWHAGAGGGAWLFADEIVVE